MFICDMVGLFGHTGTYPQSLWISLWITDLPGRRKGLPSALRLSCKLFAQRIIFVKYHKVEM
jgi:hypothetical protein